MVVPSFSQSPPMQNTDAQWLLRLNNDRAVGNDNESHPIHYFLDPKQETIIGRTPKCDIVIDPVVYPTVSRQHVKISFVNEGGQYCWQVCDLNATNGTFINNQRLSGCHFLNPGDRILLGREGAELIFEYQTVNVTVFSSRQTLRQEASPTTNFFAPSTSYQAGSAQSRPLNPPTSAPLDSPSRRSPSPIANQSHSLPAQAGSAQSRSLNSPTSAPLDSPSKRSPSPIANQSHSMPAQAGSAQSHADHPPTSAPFSLHSLLPKFQIVNKSKATSDNSELVTPPPPAPEPKAVAPNFAPQPTNLDSTYVANRQTGKSLWNLVREENIKVLSGHLGSVRTIAFSPNCQILASGSDDKTIKLWYLATGEEIQTLDAHRMAVNTVAFSPDGRVLASGSDDKTIKLWNLSTGEEIQTLDAHRMAVNTVAFSPDGQILASGSDDRTVKLWNLFTGEEIQTILETRMAVNAIAFNQISSTQSIILAIAGADRTIRLLDLQTGKDILQISSLQSAINTLAFSPDNQVLASGNGDKTIELWDIHTGKQLRTIAGYLWQVGSIAISPDGQQLASGSEGNTVKTWYL